jgi:hypothetical protein
LTISEEIPKPFSRGTADVIIDFALGAPSIEDTAALSPESSALAGNIQMPPTRSMMRSSQGMLSGSTDHKTLTKRERESDECNLVESSSKLDGFQNSLPQPLDKD